MELTGKIINISYRKNDKKYDGKVLIEYTKNEYVKAYPYTHKDCHVVAKTLDESGDYLKGMYLYLDKSDLGWFRW